jgi:hypothetical protein
MEGALVALNPFIPAGDARSYYLTNPDCSGNEEAKPVPFVRGQDIVEGVNESPMAWRPLRSKKTKIVKID